MKTRFCTHCGKKIPSDSTVCPYCGTKVVSLTQVTQLNNRDHDKDVTENKGPIDNGSVSNKNPFRFFILWSILSPLIFGILFQIFGNSTVENIPFDYPSAIMVMGVIIGAIAGIYFACRSFKFHHAASILAVLWDIIAVIIAIIISLARIFTGLII